MFRRHLGGRHFGICKGIPLTASFDRFWSYINLSKKIILILFWLPFWKAFSQFCPPEIISHFFETEFDHQVCIFFILGPFEPGGGAGMGKHYEP